MSTYVRRDGLLALGLFLLTTISGRDVSAAEPSAPSARSDSSGDPLPPLARLRIGTTRLRHGGAIRAVSYSPDGRIAASAGLDHSLRLWDLATGKGLAHWHAPNCVAITFAERGKSLLWCDERGTLYRCDAGLRGEDLSGQRQRVHSLGLASSERINAVAFVPDGSGAVLGTSEGDVDGWGSVGSGQIHLNSGIQGLAVAAGGRLLAVNKGREGISLFDMRSRREIRSFGTAAVRSVAFSPDEQILAVGDFENRVHFRDVNTGREIRLLEGHGRVPVSGRNGVFCVAFAPGGTTLASGAADGTVRLWDVKAGKELARCAGHGASVHALAFTPDGKQFASGGGDHVLRLWDSATGREVGPVGDRNGAVMGMSVSADGRMLALVRMPGRLNLWDLRAEKEGRKLPELPAPIRAAVFSPDGQTLVTASVAGHLQFWNAITGEQVRPMRNVQTTIHLLAVAGDGQKVAWYGSDRRIVLWDAQAGKVLREIRPQGNTVSSLFFTPDRQALLSAGTAGVQLWNIGAGEVDREAASRSGGVLAAAISPEGRMLATGGPDGTVRLWEMASGNQRRAMYGDTAFVRAIAFAPDRALLATGSSNGTVRLWDVSTGQRVHTFVSPQGGVIALAFAARGSTLITAGEDGTSLVWDLPGLLEAGRARVVELTERQLQTLWRDLASADAARAYEAVQTLARAPAGAVPFLREHVHRMSAERLAQLMKELDSDTFTVRTGAMKELAQMGKFAEASLRKLIAERPSVEARRRAEELLELLTDPVAMTEHLRMVRAVEALEMIGNEPARQVLRAVAAGSAEAPLTRQAKDALTRLERK
jgi:WD40 repeat protein